MIVNLKGDQDDARDIIEAIRELTSDAASELDWISRLPELALHVPAPDDENLRDVFGSYPKDIDLTGNPAKVQTETAEGTFTLNPGPGHTASITGLGIHCRLQQATPWFVECDDPESFEAVAGTWSVQDGSLLVQVNGEDVVDGVIGAGGRVIISGGTADITEIPDRTPEVYSNLMIAIRLPNPNP